jgi:hypothetical protein
MTTIAPPRPAANDRRTDPERLRRLLARLGRGGRDAWATDPEAADFAELLVDRFADLAVRHGLEPADGGRIAYLEVRKGAGGRPTDRDPWAVIVHATEVAVHAEQAAAEMLCSQETARRGGLRGLHLERMSQREAHVWDAHPAFHAADHAAEPPTEWAGLEVAVEVFAAVGWPRRLAAAGIDAIAQRLADIGSRETAVEALRRDHATAMGIGFPPGAWSRAVRVLCGHPGPEHAGTNTGYGLLFRIAAGHTLAGLLADGELAAQIRRALEEFR